MTIADSTKFAAEMRAMGVGILLEPTGDVGLEARLVALGIERRAPALGRCEGDLGTDIFEDIVRRRRFLQPEAGSCAPCCRAGRGR